MKYQPLFIIGAGRSGTNILRDILHSQRGWETWDCDEINLIWRHQNTNHPNDLFTPALARPDVKRYLVNYFNHFSRKTNANTLLEKTCANSLRVPFIEAVFPNARYIYLTRDGRDVALSASKRWRASIEPRYLLKKLRYVPPMDVPRHGLRFLKNRLYQRFSEQKRQSFWGPVFPGMQAWAKDKPLAEICARQWVECIQASDQAFSKMETAKVFHLRYEDMVSHPEKSFADLANWYGEGANLGEITPMLSQIRPPSSKAWETDPEFFTEDVTAILNPTLKAHGYV